MRCQYKNCGGLIIEQKAFGPYPRRSYCHLCGRELIEESQDSDHPKGGREMPEDPQTKICAACKIPKPIMEFGILRSSEDGHNPRCKICKRQDDRDRTAARAKKAKPLERSPKADKPKISDLPKKETVTHGEETVTAEARLIEVLKKSAVKNFIELELIPMLAKAVKERFT